MSPFLKGKLVGARLCSSHITPWAIGSTSSYLFGEHLLLNSDRPPFLGESQKRKMIIPSTVAGSRIPNFTHLFPASLSGLYAHHLQRVGGGCFFGGTIQVIISDCCTRSLYHWTREYKEVPKQITCVLNMFLPAPVLQL